MDNCTTESVKSAFGSEFQEYCARNKILLKKNKCGAFMVPNVSGLKNCIDTLGKYTFKVDDQLKKIQNYISASKNSDDKKRVCKKLMGKYKTDENREENFCSETTNITPRLFLTNLDLQLNLCDTPSTLSSYTIHGIRTNYILNTAKDGNEIYEYILKKTMKDAVIVDYEASISFISPLLESLQKRHKRFHYSSVLKHLRSKQVPGRELKWKNEVTIKQLKSFFDLILAKVVPLNIFGKLKNLKVIKKAMFHLLNRPRWTSLNLLPYIEKLDITSITWLRNIQSIKTQWLIIAKVMKWFFTGFLIKILCIQFHITSLSATNNKRLYITHLNWHYDRKQYIKKKEHSNTLQPDIECDEWSPSIGVYKLRPKHSSLRPIFIPQYKADEQNDLHIVFTFLKQLNVTEYGLSDFHENWKTIVQYKYNSQSEKLYLVSCDIVEAFGSIVQSELYDIIQTFCRKLPETLVLKFYAVKNKRHVNCDTLCHKKYFSDPNLQIPLSSGTLYACTRQTDSQFIEKTWLLDKIWRNIFHQRVQVHKKSYIIGKGLVQGTMLSPILSEIYYNFVLNKKLSIFLNSGKIIKYMDDILYCTENEMFAKKFLQLTKTGIPQYNCKFNASKTSSNVAYNENTAMKSITYIGYKINCDTLEVKPVHRTTDIRYVTSFTSKHDITPIELFRKRLYNISCLKLSKVVFDSAINSAKTIINILENTCLVQAKRAHVLIQELFNDVQKNIQSTSIVTIIKMSNKKIATYVTRLFLKSKENIPEECLYSWYKMILSILWESYKKIFKHDNIFGKYFIKACTK